MSCYGPKRTAKEHSKRPQLPLFHRRNQTRSSVPSVFVPSRGGRVEGWLRGGRTGSLRLPGAAHRTAPPLFFARGGWFAWLLSRSPPWLPANFHLLRYCWVIRSAADAFQHPHFLSRRKFDVMQKPPKWRLGQSQGTGNQRPVDQG